MNNAITDKLHSVRATVRRCAANYGGFRNVIGVSLGSKFRRGRREPGSRCVQFFVSEKVPLERLRRRLPGFVHPRTSDGTVNRQERLDTDVIELRNLRLCCGAGSRLARVGGNGATTLMFRDQVPGSNAVYAVSCAHVVGDVFSGHSPGGLMVGGTDECVFLAQIIGGTVAQSQSLEYDIGLVEVQNPDPGFDYLGVQGQPGPITRMAARADIVVQDSVQCAFPVSGTTQATIESVATRLDGIAMGQETLGIDNLIAARGRAQPGDSGGLLFQGDRAIGVLVAQADDDWLFFHPLADAIAHLKATVGLSFELFPAN